MIHGSMFQWRQRNYLKLYIILTRYTISFGPIFQSSTMQLISNTVIIKINLSQYHSMKLLESQHHDAQFLDTWCHIFFIYSLFFLFSVNSRVCQLRDDPFFKDILKWEEDVSICQSISQYLCKKDEKPKK